METQRFCWKSKFLVQREWDILAVRIVRWATIFRPTRGTQRRFVNTLPGEQFGLRVLIIMLRKLLM